MSRTPGSSSTSRMCALTRLGCTDPDARSSRRRGADGGIMSGVRRRETTAESERDQLERLLERLHQGVVAVDRSGTVRFANPAARRLLGAPTLAQGDPLPEPWPELPLRRFAAALFSRG